MTGGDVVLGDLALASPWFLLGLLPVLGLAVRAVRRRRRREAPAMMFPSAQLVAGLPRTPWARLEAAPDAARLLALAALVVALARPQRVGTPTPGETEGIDVVVALDTSGSMQAADFQPRDRMFVARQSLAAFVQKRSTDRIGLVVFAGEAATWVPLTLDYSMLVDLLDEVQVGMLPDGTAIGSAIGTALNRLRASAARSKVIVLLTDGDSNAGSISPRKAAELAKELGVKIFTILVGRGGPVPFPAGKDVFGRPVFREQVVPINPALLEELAATTGGAAYTAKDGEELDARLAAVLDTLERTRIETTARSAPRDELFAPLVALALALVALELALRATRLRRFP
jgi:Ca-activated chloride channel family protein